MDIERSMTSGAVIRELGTQIKNYRISRQLTQRDLAERSGVSLRSISRFEQGEDIQLGNLVKILRSLDLTDNLNMLVPDVAKSPSYYLKSTPKKRVRKKKSDDKTIFKWGDEL